MLFYANSLKFRDLYGMILANTVDMCYYFMTDFVVFVTVCV